MDAEKESAYLKQVTFFSDLAEEDIAQLMSAAKRRTFRVGEVIFHRDDPGQVLYMIKEGKVKICIISPDGQEISLAVLRQGRIFRRIFFARWPAALRRCHCSGKESNAIPCSAAISTTPS